MNAYTQVENARFQTILTPAPSGITRDEWSARLDLAACYRMVCMYGWTSVVYNHITLRIPNTDHLLINPFGLRYDEIRASDLIRIDLDGNSYSESEWSVNQAGYVIHSAVHKARPDLHCVLHTHEPYSQALCATDTDVIPVTQEGCQFFERVGYHDYEGIVLDGSEAPRIEDALGEKNHTLVLKNHGLLTAGDSCAWAFIRHQAFIRNADVQLRAMAAGKINQISPDVMRKTRQQFEGGDAQAGAKIRHPEWPALVRQIDQLDPTWKE
ncbi:class II aldolase/adducin family protein [Litorivicinus sp.]|jgi:ribulose-5-phosphate 4-epimerase/fuculose-1-phosphate aldolase|nr:class II aldolase/adducin family protein [Litorivicinus sp.]MDC1207983.1 class II aldolase/adducin family protein [Litorivicinus sp.]MDC1240537.1 class II aldolase/adducin family protein [Litorivicinus sp.]MDC1466793.1 class II aldolase/adducin family protein [Litorivicinus sp.]